VDLEPPTTRIIELEREELQEEEREIQEIKIGTT
jgi:hypothetical protein